MSIEDFLEIYKHPLYKLNLVKVKFVKKDNNENNRKYFHFIGMFEFIPPDSILETYDEKMKKEILIGLKIADKDLFSLVFRKRFSRKVKSKNKKDKWKFEYVFDFAPKNIVDFSVDKKTGIMTLFVKGYGIF